MHGFWYETDDMSVLYTPCGFTFKFEMDGTCRVSCSDRTDKVKYVSYFAWDFIAQCEAFMDQYPAPNSSSLRS